MIVAVTGGRDYRISREGYLMLDAILWRWRKRDGEVKLLSGHCPTSFNIDKDAEAWAKKNNVEVILYEADWAKHGRGAGPRRNAEMACELENNNGILLLFKGGRGTLNMRNECVKRLVPIIDLTNELYSYYQPQSPD